MEPGLTGFLKGFSDTSLKLLTLQRLRDQQIAREDYQKEQIKLLKQKYEGDKATRVLREQVLDQQLKKLLADNQRAAEFAKGRQDLLQQLEPAPALDGRSQGPASSNGHTAPQEAPGQAIAPQGDSQAAQEAPPSTIAPQPLPEVVKGQDDPQATPQACPLPEAAASMNCYLDIAGYKVQVTLRGSDEHQVLARLEALLKRFPAPPPTATPAATAASTKPAEPQVPEGWCRLHDQQMQHWPGKDGRKAWWSHRLPNGEWCKGR